MTGFASVGLKIESLRQGKSNRLQIVSTSVCSPMTSVALRVLPTKPAFSNTSHYN